MRTARFHVLHAVLLAVVFVLGPISQPAKAGADDIRFTAELSDDEQSTPTYSKGKGHAELILERETLKLSWTITYQDLSSAPLKAGLYGPENVGATSGLLIDLGTAGLKSPIKGSAILTDGQLQYLITGRIYVNILSQTWKDGELRGQLRREAPASPTPRS
jgi:hypothetical protein